MTDNQNILSVCTCVLTAPAKSDAQKSGTTRNVFADTGNGTENEELQLQDEENKLVSPGPAAGPVSIRILSLFKCSE